MLFNLAFFLLQADTTGTDGGQFLGVEWADPVIWATILGFVLLGAAYVFSKARFILNPLGLMLRQYANYKREESHGGKRFTDREKAEMWETHIEPLLHDIAARLGNPMVDRLLGIHEPAVEEAKQEGEINSTEKTNPDGL